MPFCMKLEQTHLPYLHSVGLSQQMQSAFLRVPGEEVALSPIRILRSNLPRGFQWNVKRILAKVNYRIHTDAVRDNLIPPQLTSRQKSYVYTDEADLLNVVLFGMTAAEWRKANPDKSGNMRDDATIEQLLVLANLENVNALYIAKGIPQTDRLQELNQMARTQLTALLGNSSVRGLKALNKGNTEDETDEPS